MAKTPTPEEEPKEAAAEPKAEKKAKKSDAPEYKAKEHLKGPGKNEAVHQQKLDRIDEDWGIGPRDPYPTGNPRPVEEEYYEVHGAYPAKEE